MNWKLNFIILTIVCLISFQFMDVVSAGGGGNSNPEIRPVVNANNGGWYAGLQAIWTFKKK